MFFDGPALALDLLMLSEMEVRRALGLAAEDSVQELGVFIPPEVDWSGELPEARLPSGEELALSEEWLSDTDLEGHFSNEPTLTALLWRGRAKRLDVDPRILVFENIPTPRWTQGRVTSFDGRWVLDSRSQPAILELSNQHRELVFWGQEGKIRIYAVERRR